MSVYEKIMNRRSIRAYLDKPLEHEQIRMILSSARWAPSAGNRQPWHFIIVLNRELKGKLVSICRNQKFVGDASAIIVGLADMDRAPKWAIVDTKLAL